jgi:hypothetical protein
LTVPPPPKKRGIYTDSAKDDKDRVADFSYQNDALAEMIVYAWAHPSFKTRLLTPAGAAAELAARGIFLKNPVVIEEKDYLDGYVPTTPDVDVVFVLPDEKRTMAAPAGMSLLETAKLLMACTPNGI